MGKQKEQLKIVKFNGLDDLVLSNKLLELSNHFKTSNRRTLQFCLAESHKIITLPKPPRFYSDRIYCSVLFIPFANNGLNKCNNLIDTYKITFKQLVSSSINMVYDLYKDGTEFEKSKTYDIYINTIYNQDFIKK